MQITHQSIHGPVSAGSINANQSESDGFGKLFSTAMAAPGSGMKPAAGEPSTLREAARQMEVHLVTSMLKTMDAASENGGLLGNRSEGMGFFKDQFFGAMAEEIVSRQSLGFSESLENTYAPGRLDGGSVKIGLALADETE